MFSTACCTVSLWKKPLCKGIGMWVAPSKAVIFLRRAGLGYVNVGVSTRFKSDNRVYCYVEYY
jgi:hypothetical protein